MDFCFAYAPLWYLFQEQPLVKIGYSVQGTILKEKYIPLSTAELERLFWLGVFKMLEIPVSSSVYISELAVSLK